MHCPECDFVMAAHRRNCPQCGAPTRQDPHEAGPGERSPEELKRNRRNVLIIGALLVFGTAAMSPFSWLGFGVNRATSERDRSPVVIEAQQLYDAYRRDDRGANRRYRNREMVVSGEFVRIVPDGNGAPDLRLKTSDPDRPFGADLIEASHEEAARLRPGQRVTVSCRRMAGDRQERWLQNCSIEAAAEGETAAPANSSG